MNKEKLLELIENYKEAKKEKIFAESKVEQSLNYMSKKRTNNADEKIWTAIHCLQTQTILSYMNIHLYLQKQRQNHPSNVHIYKK